jgi:hypothetical protein
MPNGNYFIAWLCSNRCLFILAKLFAKPVATVSKQTARRNKKTKTILVLAIATLWGGGCGRQRKITIELR